MPVKNKNRQSNSGYEGVITGLNDEEKKVLEDAGIGGGALLDITQYLHEGSISQEGYNLIQEKVSSGEVIGVFIVDMPYLFMCSQYIIENDDFAGLVFDTPTIGGDVKVRLTIKKDLSFNLEQVINSSSGSSKVWYELPNLFFLENITQKQFDEIKNLALQNQLAGINCGGFYCPLTFYQNEQSISFFFPWYENDIFTPHLIRLDTDLSVKKIPYSTITLPQTAPSSQIIPSITTSNTQQNLTIGDGLEIKNGALDVNRNGVFKTNTITISKSEISLDETNNKQINFNTTAQEKITNLFTLINQNQNNIVSIKSIIKLTDGSSFIIYMNYHAKSAINSENIQGIAISSAINNSFDLHIVRNDRWQSSADLTNFFSYIQEYEITFCYF